MMRLKGFLSKLILALFMTALMLSSTSYANERHQQMLLNKANIALQRNNATGAIKYLEHYIHKYPNAPAANDVRMILGKGYYSMGQYAKAQRILNNILQKKPSPKLAKQATSMLYKINNTLTQKNKITRYNPSTSNMTREEYKKYKYRNCIYPFNEGNDWLKRNDFSDAKKSFQKAINQCNDPNFVATVKNRMAQIPKLQREARQKAIEFESKRKAYWDDIRAKEAAIENEAAQKREANSKQFPLDSFTVPSKYRVNYKGLVLGKSNPREVSRTFGNLINDEIVDKELQKYYALFGGIHQGTKVKDLHDKVKVQCENYYQHSDCFIFYKEKLVGMSLDFGFRKCGVCESEKARLAEFEKTMRVGSNFRKVKRSDVEFAKTNGIYNYHKYGSSTGSYASGTSYKVINGVEHHNGTTYSIGGFSTRACIYPKKLEPFLSHLDRDLTCQNSQ